MARSYTLPDWVLVAIALPLTPIWVPLLCAKAVYRCLRPKPTHEEKVLRTRNATRPPQLPYSRRFHPSTDALPAPSSVPTSPLLRLPYPIRAQIYSYLFANRYVLHITTRPRRLAHTQSLYPASWRATQHLRASTQQIPPYACRLATHHLPLELLRTCRALYREAHPLVYATNTFAVHHLDALLYLNQAVRPQHLVRIRHLHLDWDMPFAPGAPGAAVAQRPYDSETWARVWNIVATRLTGLEGLDLTVRLWMAGVEDERPWLGEVAKVRGLKTFVLEVKYPSVLGLGTGVEIGEANARLRREVEKMVKWERGRVAPEGV